MSTAKTKTTVIMELLEENKRNYEKLSSCKLPHHFPESDLGYIPFHMHKCTKCGGEIDAYGLLWYNRGLEHGRNAK